MQLEAQVYKILISSNENNLSPEVKTGQDLFDEIVSKCI